MPDTPNTKPEFRVYVITPTSPGEKMMVALIINNCPLFEQDGVIKPGLKLDPKLAIEIGQNLIYIAKVAEEGQLSPAYDNPHNPASYLADAAFAVWRAKSALASANTEEGLTRYGF